jgi:hypothetical protein
MARNRRWNAKGSLPPPLLTAESGDDAPSLGGKNGLLGSQGAPQGDSLVQAMTAAINPAKALRRAQGAPTDSPPADDPTGSTIKN